MDALVAYGSGSEVSDDNGGEQQQKQASREDSREIPEHSTMDLLYRRRSCPLPLELNCEIFKCLKLQIQGKFIWGLGRGIYAMFGQKLIVKTKRLRKPAARNRWFARNRVDFLISEDGLNISVSISNIPVATVHNVSAEHGFHISGEYSRLDSFPGTLLYYYEVSVLSFHDLVRIGLSPGTGTIPAGEIIGMFRNSYTIRAGTNTVCYLSGTAHRFELPKGAIRPQRKKYANVYGCGLVLDPENKLSIFFTLNGQLLGKQIPISPSVAFLYPTIRMWEFYSEANFGDDPAKPFEYDIRNCPGLGLPCI